MLEDDKYRLLYTWTHALRLRDWLSADVLTLFVFHGFEYFVVRRCQVVIESKLTNLGWPAYIIVCSLMMWIYGGRQVMHGVVLLLSKCPNRCITEQPATSRNPMELPWGCPPPPRLLPQLGTARIVEAWMVFYVATIVEFFHAVHLCVVLDCSKYPEILT